MKTVHKYKGPANKQLTSFLRSKLSENGMIISEESLVFTAERYASKIMSNPNLDASSLIDEDIKKVKKLLKQINQPH